MPSRSTSPSSASVKRGIASTSLPCFSSSSARKYNAVSLAGSRSPSVSLCPCSASSYSGLASSSWPISSSNWAMLKSSIFSRRSAAGSRPSAARP
eukprot:scaffold28220_cov74-Phaeocystis_antarctica.AAC.4